MEQKRAVSISKLPLNDIIGPYQSFETNQYRDFILEGDSPVNKNKKTSSPYEQSAMKRSNRSRLKAIISPLELQRSVESMQSTVADLNGVRKIRREQIINSNAKAANKFRDDLLINQGIKASVNEKSNDEYEMMVKRLSESPKQGRALSIVESAKRETQQLLNYSVLPSA